jgi:hypothetical protein
MTLVVIFAIALGVKVVNDKIEALNSSLIKRETEKLNRSIENIQIKKTGDEKLVDEYLKEIPKANLSEVIKAFNRKFEGKFIALPYENKMLVSDGRQTWLAVPGVGIIGQVELEGNISRIISG